MLGRIAARKLISLAMKNWWWLSRIIYNTRFSIGSESSIKTSSLSLWLIQVNNLWPGHIKAVDVLAVPGAPGVVHDVRISSIPGNLQVSMLPCWNRCKFYEFLGINLFSRFQNLVASYNKGVLFWHVKNNNNTKEKQKQNNVEKIGTRKTNARNINSKAFCKDRVAVQYFPFFLLFWADRAWVVCSSPPTKSGTRTPKPTRLPNEWPCFLLPCRVSIATASLICLLNNEELMTLEL